MSITNSKTKLNEDIRIHEWCNSTIYLICNIKHILQIFRAMEILDLLLNYQLQLRVEVFIIKKIDFYFSNVLNINEE